jgi:hypothetical protein
MYARADRHEIRSALREKWGYLGRLSAMGDKEDQETMFQEMNAHQLAEKTARVRVFIRKACKRGHRREDILALLDEPGMTVKEAVERILSTRKST